MIRSVQVKDAGQIRDLCHQALGYDSTLEKVAAQIDNFNQPDSGHFCFVYEEGQTGHILGYVEAEVYESLYSDAGLNILGLAVFPSAQGRGIGRQLMERVEELAKSKHYAFIRLNSASHRKEAHLFYERIGYEGNKTQKRFLKIMN
ncbi:GNAT family N-acetyltransferase [Streptococcus parasanguinis]|uniref:Acetyltransferase, GNAT family n=1 Tax=Streptococcus parasanguinis F0405 TaxID=905067 RepID=E3CBD1_STRPA|nr:GNAT family N-acetyltransferase [Streptococcus parasanguinis]EFQ55959.1 acetyltransferase, GNAT family [Streptococcus parasanguinis F0405]